MFTVSGLPVQWETVLNTTEVASRLSVARITVIKWCVRGLFPTARKVGRDWVIPEADVKKFKPPNPKGGYPKGRPRKSH